MCRIETCHPLQCCDSLLRDKLRTADESLLSEALKQVRQMTDRRDTGLRRHQPTLQMATEMVKKLGLFTMVGYDDKILPFNNLNVPLYTLQSWHLMGAASVQDLIEVVELLKTGMLAW